MNRSDPRQDNGKVRLCTISITADGLDARAATSSGVAYVRGDAIGQYVVEREIGRGGMAVVYAGRDAVLGRAVAIKVVKPSWHWRKEAVARFSREAKTLAQVEHPGVVGLYQFIEDQGGVAMVMELVSGPNLDATLASGRSFSSEEALSVLCDILEALAHMHSLDIIHRDLSTRNVVWCDRRQRYRLLDFGLAKAMEDSLELSQPGIVLGTPHFMSPEQARGGPTDERTDLFSAGIILYVLLTGRYPHPAKTSGAVVEFLRSEAPFASEPLEQVHDRGIRAILMKALQKRLDDRYASASEMLKDIRDCLTQQEKQGAPPANSIEPGGASRGVPEDDRLRKIEANEMASDKESAVPSGGIILLVAIVVFVTLAILAIVLLFHTPG